MAMTSDRIDVIKPADHVPGPKQGHWTTHHYAVLPDDGRRYEIIDGVLYMAPAPGDAHQNAASQFCFYLMQHVQHKGLGKVRVSPYDVELAPDIVVQPDVVVILNAHLDVITTGGVVGTPDLIVEIASPSTATHDRNKKYLAYEHAGICEYWIADPIAQTIEILLLEEGKYQTLGVFTGKASIPSRIVPTIVGVRVEEFFA